MAYAGIEVRDEAGNVILDATFKPFVTMGTFNTTNVNGSIALPMTDVGTFAYFLRPLNYTVGTTQRVHPIVTWANGVATWRFPTESTWPSNQVTRVPATVFWGTN